MRKNETEQKYMKFNGKVYVVNFKKLKEVCLNSSMDGGCTKEIEISQTYERQDNGEFELSGKLEHETKLVGSTQNDMIIYDIVKLMFINILENDSMENTFCPTLGTSLSLNTLINWGVIEEIE
jgi:hypothetical protein